MEKFLHILLIVVICIVALFILAIVLTVLYENSRKKKGKKRKPESLWEDRRRNFFGMPWSFTKYSMDKTRFYLERGFLSTRYDEVRLYRITDVVLVRSLLQKIFGLGTLKIDSSDKSMGDFVIENIRDSEKVKELFSQKVEEQRKANRVYTRETLGDSDNDMDNDGVPDDIDEDGGMGGN